MGREMFNATKKPQTVSKVYHNPKTTDVNTAIYLMNNYHCLLPY